MVQAEGDRSGHHFLRRGIRGVSRVFSGAFASPDAHAVGQRETIPVPISQFDARSVAETFGMHIGAGSGGEGEWEYYGKPWKSEEIDPREDFIYRGHKGEEWRLRIRQSGTVSLSSMTHAGEDTSLYRATSVTINSDKGTMEFHDPIGQLHLEVPVGQDQQHRIARMWQNGGHTQTPLER